ncbi:MAG: helix-turn-helix transcriptional regulator [Planctomycetes bacterium]|nr:helix-turn-helix transcriptional regulator [Planctomycetota bacterium]
MNKRHDLGELLRASIRKSGLSLKRLSDDSGVPYAAVWRIVNDGADPRLTTVSRLSAVLGLTLTTTKRRAR